MSRALAIAGENITAATNNNSTRSRRIYLNAAREALDSVDLEQLPPSKKGIHSMLLQKLQTIDPVTYPQFSPLAGWELSGPPLLADSKWRYLTASALLGTTAIFLIGQPTLLQVFSDSLEVQLWDRGEIIRNNLLAMGAILGLLIVWKKLRP